MVLLTPRAPPTEDDTVHWQPRRRRRPGRRSRRACQAQREWDHPNSAQAQGDAPHSAGTPCPAVGTGSLVGDLSSLSLGKGRRPVACSDAPSSSSAPPPPEESTPAKQSPTMAPSPYPFGLRNATASYAYAYASIHAGPQDTTNVSPSTLVPRLRLTPTPTPRRRTRRGPKQISPGFVTLKPCAAS